MKCFSVHMSKGIIEGIRTSGSAHDHILVGHPDKRCVYIPITYKKDAERSEQLMTADLQWMKKIGFQTLEGMASPVIVKYRLRPGNSVQNHALVMIGTLQKEQFCCAFDEHLQPVVFPEVRSRKSGITQLRHGLYYNHKLEGYIKQSLYIMKPGSVIAIFPKNPQSHESTFVRWDGSELTLLRDIDLADLVLAASTA